MTLTPTPRNATVQLALLPLAAFPSPRGLPVRSPGGFPVGTPLDEAVPWNGIRSNSLHVTVAPRNVSMQAISQRSLVMLGPF